MDAGIQFSTGLSIANPLPISWMGRNDAPGTVPNWANIGILTGTQTRNLLAQIGYDASTWNYQLIGSKNQLGRYQINTTTLELYGLLAAGSNNAYGINCINYKNCWHPIIINGKNAYQNYFYNITGLQNFLLTTIAQDHLAYQILADLYTSASLIGVIKSADSAEIVAGMIYVAWTLRVGTPATTSAPNGSGAWAWRYNNIGTGGTNSFNSGRYAATTLGI